MLTPEQLEAAARKLCEIRGKNPDEQTQFGYFDWDTKKLTPFTWLKACENEIRAHLEIQEAIQSVPQPSPRIFLKRHPEAESPDGIEEMWRLQRGL